jgi:alanine-synthesizing transaminase
VFSQRTGWNLDPNRLSQTLGRLRSSGTPILDLTISNPTACGFAADSEKILNSLANPASLKYEPNPRGLETARRAVASYYAERGAQAPIDAIFLTTGTSEAYSFVMRLLCNPGDELLVPEPSYPLLSFLADIEDVALVPYALVFDDGWRMDLDRIEKAITPRTRAVVVIHPNNPTGNYCRSNDVRRLAALCAQRGLSILADEVFFDFALDGALPQSFAGIREALTFTLSGLSKISGLPQMKAAWILVSGPEPAKTHARERLEVIADTFLSMSAPIQLALPALLDLRRDFQRQLLARVRENLAELDRQLDGCPSCRRLPVEAGWYVVLRMESGRSDEDFAVELLTRKGVYIHPGHFYDFSGDGYLVVSLIVPPAEFADGIQRLLSLR